MTFERLTKLKHIFGFLSHARTLRPTVLLCVSLSWFTCVTGTSSLPKLSVVVRCGLVLQFFVWATPKTNTHAHTVSALSVKTRAIYLQLVDNLFLLLHSLHIKMLLSCFVSDANKKLIELGYIRHQDFVETLSNTLGKNKNKIG